MTRITTKCAVRFVGEDRIRGLPQVIAHHPPVITAHDNLILQLSPQRSVNGCHWIGRDRGIVEVLAWTRNRKGRLLILVYAEGVIRYGRQHKQLVWNDRQKTCASILGRKLIVLVLVF